MELQKMQEPNNGVKLKGKTFPRWLKWILGLTMILALGGYLLLPKLKNNSISVNTVKLERQDLKKTVVANGSLAAAHEQEFFTPVDSTLMEINVKVGDRVKKGKVLGRLDTLELGRIYEEAKAILAGKEASLAKAKAQNDDLMLNQVETRYKKAKTQLERKQYLYEEGAATAEEVETAEVEFVQAETEYQEILIKVKESATEKEISSLQAQVDLAVQEVAQAKERLSLATFVASENGVVLYVGAEKGNRVQEGSRLLVIGNDKTLEVTANVNEMDAGSLEVGQKVEITCVVLPGKVYQGEVSRVAAAAVSQSINGSDLVSVPVTVKLTGKNDGLRLGYTVDLIVTTIERDQVLMVPMEAVTDYEGKKVAYVVENGLVHEREIRTETGNELYDVVISGVKEDAEVILNPTDDIKEGQEVTVQVAGEKND